MIKWLSNLIKRSEDVAVEQTASANSAQRIGTLLADGFRSMVAQWDTDLDYKSGQWVIFNGQLKQAQSDTLKGQSPDTHKAKWSQNIVLDLQQIALGNFDPVSANALKQLIDSGQLGSGGGNAPQATTLVAGISRRATDQEIDEGTVDDAYISAKGNKDYLGRLFADFVAATLDTAARKQPELLNDQSTAVGVAVTVNELGENGNIVARIIRHMSRIRFVDWLGLTFGDVAAKGGVSSMPIRVGSLVIEQAPTNYSAPYIFVGTPTPAGFLDVGVSNYDAFTDIQYARLKLKLGIDGLLGGGGGGGVAFSEADWEAMFNFFYYKTTFLEGRTDVAPAYPVLSGGGSGAGGAISYADAAAIEQHAIAVLRYAEGWINSATGLPYPAPGPLVLPGGGGGSSGGGTTVPTLPAKVNFVDHKITTEGHVIGLGNCSNGNLFFAMLKGRNNSSWTDTEWLLYHERFDGNDLNGGYSRDFGVVPSGKYTLLWRAGADASTVKSVDFEITISGPIAQFEFRIICPALPARNYLFEDETNVVFKLQQRYLQGTTESWVNFIGNQDWSLQKRLNGPNVPSGFGWAGDVNGVSLSAGDVNLLSQDAPVLLVCEFGIRLELPFLLKNRPTTPAPPAEGTIHFFSVKYDANGMTADVNASILNRVGLRANGAPPVDETIHQTENYGGIALPNPSSYHYIWGMLPMGGYRVDVYKGLTGTTPFQTIDFVVAGVTGPANIPVQEVRTYGLTGGSGVTTWSTDPSNIAVINSSGAATGLVPGTVAIVAVSNGVTYRKEGVQVTGGSGNPGNGQVETIAHYEMIEPAPNTILRVQYRFLVNGLGSGSDLLEIQMLDGYAEQPMFIAVLLTSQAAPASINTGYYRDYAQHQAGTPVAKGFYRSHKLASGQNLKNKSFRVYINTSTSGVNPLLTLDIVTTIQSTDGFVNIYGNEENLTYADANSADFS